MRGRAPPLQMGQEMWGLLRSGPGTASQGCHSMADGQIDALNTSGVESSREAQSLSSGFESGLCAKAYHRRDARQLAPAIACLHLAGDQARLHQPPAHVAPLATQLEPLTKVSREGREGEIEPVTGKERDATRKQGLSQGVKNHVRQVVRAGTQAEHRKKLRAGINGQPEPEHLWSAA
jgi:hypothetical protein